jgi:hypothetical protein
MDSMVQIKPLGAQREKSIETDRAFPERWIGT